MINKEDLFFLMIIFVSLAILIGIVSLTYVTEKDKCESAGGNFSNDRGWSCYKEIDNKIVKGVTRKINNEWVFIQDG